MTSSPAARDTILAHFEDLRTGPEDFDLIVTGDLGSVGRQALCALLEREGVKLSSRLVDCGNLIFDPKTQDVHAGGSGCGCSAVVLCSDLLGRMQSGALRKMLFCGTGALLSPTSTQQKLPIPGVCHAVCISRR